MEDKLRSLTEAIGECVGNGDSIVLGANLEPNIPFAAAYEMVRQGRRNLHIIAPISDMAADLLIGAGCVGEVSTAWVGNVSGGLGHNYRRAVEHGIPRSLRVHDFSNFSLGMALMAAAYGMPYAPVRSLLGSEILASNPAFRVAENPFADSESPEPVALVPPLKPDVAILAVQRADRHGGSHVWGNLGVAQEAALAAERLILLTEELVDPGVIASDPNRVLFPAFRVSAVCHVPAGAHPSPMTGVWKRDTEFFDEYHRCSREVEGFREWLDEWVIGLPDHAALRHRLGQRLEDLRIRSHAFSAPANFAAE
jgi:glutaconate CoA-transferase subunit A